MFNSQDNEHLDVVEKKSNDVSWYWTDFAPSFEEVYVGSTSLVYKCTGKSDGKKFTLKVLSFRSRLPRHLSNLEHEASILQLLSGAKHVVQLERRISNTQVEALLLEDFGGRALSEELKKGPLDLESFLFLGKEIATGLGEVHEHGLIHFDVKPSNIIWNKESKIVKLADFGLSCFQKEEDIDCIGFGTRGFRSPEQCTSASMSIDHRVDFFSLGVCFFLMLSGELPFPLDTTNQLGDPTLIRRAPKLHKNYPSIPKCVSLVVDKLLHKMPNDRYQNAYAIVEDLKICEEIISGTRDGSDFRPGQVNDVCSFLLFSKKIYGRDKEIAQLAEIHENCRANASNALVIISGLSGVGKTALVDDFSSSVETLFMQGKHNVETQTMPYIGLFAAITSLIDRFLLLPTVDEVVKAITEKIPDNLGLLNSYIPSLVYLVGEQPAVPELNPIETKHRFEHTICDMFQCFSQLTRGPLILFLDDIQWADSATFSLLQKILLSPDINILVIYGCRTEHGKTNTINFFIEEMCNSVDITEMTLEPLSESTVSEMMAGILSSKEITPEIRELSHIVFEKTLGNPFFVKKFCSMLQETGLVTYSSRDSRWNWNLEEILKLRVSDNVAELVADSIQQLDNQTTTLLSYGSLFGNCFDIKKIALICDVDIGEAEKCVWEAMRQGYVLHSSEGTFNYKFQHDKVMEASRME